MLSSSASASATVSVATVDADDVFAPMLLDIMMDDGYNIIMPFG